MQVNTEKTELALKNASSEISIFVTDAELEVKALEEKFSTLVPDASNKEGYAHCKSVRADLLPIKTKLENARKTLKAPILDAGKLIDSSIKPLAERVEGLYKPFETAYREVDNEKKRREEERQQKVRLAFDRLTDFIVTASGASSTVIETLIDDLADFDLDPKVFQERTDEAAEKHSDVMQKLSSLLIQAVEQEEFTAKQKEMEERERKVRDAEAREQARIEEEKRKEEQAKRDTELAEARKQAEEQARIDAEKRHAEQLKQAEERAKVQAEQAAKLERERIEKEQRRIKEEEVKREADKKHKTSIHNAILVELIKTGITEEQAKSIITLVAKRKAGSMYIQY